MVFPCHGILFRHKKEQTTNISYSIDSALKHYAEKPDAKDYILFPFIRNVQKK